MMNLEDKIIAYLDGTLDETSRAELLHTLSVSPEKRKLLEEHIKLREIISLGHKPASVPLMTERKLADRIPLLMQELPYLAEKSNRVAAPIIGSSTSYFTLLGRQVSNFFTSRLGQAVSLGTLALIGGMSWYMAQSNGDEQINSTKPAITHSQSTSSSDAGQTGTRSSEKVEKPEADAKNGASGPNTSLSASPVSASMNQSSKLVKSGLRKTDQSFANNAGSTPGVGSSQNGSSKIDQPSDANHNAPSKESVSSSSTDNNAANRAKEIEQKTEPSKNITDPKDLPPLPLPSKERNVTGKFTFQADYSTSVSVRPNVAQQKYETTSGIGFPIMGIGYEFDRHFAIGVEGGKSSLSQQQQTVDKPRGSQGPVNSPISVNERVTYTTGVNDVNAYWTQATFRYSTALTEKIDFELSAGGGAAFVNGIAPMVSAGLATTYDLGEVVAITAGVTGRGAWLSGVNAQEDATTTLKPGEATAVVSHRPLTDDLFSSSISGRLGIRLRFF